MAMKPSYTTRWDTIRSPKRKCPKTVRKSYLSPRRIQRWKRLRMSGRFAGVGEILTELAVAVINFEGRSLELNNSITVDVLDIWRFPSHYQLPSQNIYSRSL